MNDTLKRIVGILIVALLLGTLCYYGNKMISEKTLQKDVEKTNVLFEQIQTVMQNQQPPETFAAAQEEIEKIAAKTSSPLLKFTTLVRLSDVYFACREQEKVMKADAEAVSLMKPCLKMLRKDEEKFGVIARLVPLVGRYYLYGQPEQAVKLRDELTQATGALGPEWKIRFMASMMSLYANLVLLDINSAEIAEGYAAEMEGRIAKMDETQLPEKAQITLDISGCREFLQRAKAEYAEAVKKAEAAKNGEKTSPDAEEKAEKKAETPERPGLKFSIDDM